MKKKDIVEELAYTDDDTIEGFSVEEINKIMTEAGYGRCLRCKFWYSVDDLSYGCNYGMPKTFRCRYC